MVVDQGDDQRFDAIGNPISCVTANFVRQRDVPAQQSFTNAQAFGEAEKSHRQYVVARLDRSDVSSTAIANFELAVDRIPI